MSKVTIFPEQQTTFLSSSGIPSVPAESDNYITNLYVNAITGKLEIDYEDTPGSSPTIQSLPTLGNYAITNLYVADGKLVVKYDQT